MSMKFQSKELIFLSQPDLRILARKHGFICICGRYRVKNEHEGVFFWLLLFMYN